MSGLRVPQVDAHAIPEDAHILDVREPEEWVAGHIEGAQHIPMSQLLDRLAEVPEDSELVVVCKVGSRSAQVAAYLNQRGMEAANLDGGMYAWVEAGRPMVSETGDDPFIY